MIEAAGGIVTELARRTGPWRWAGLGRRQCRIHAKAHWTLLRHTPEPSVESRPEALACARKPVLCPFSIGQNITRSRLKGAKTAAECARDHILIRNADRPDHG